MHAHWNFLKRVDRFRERIEKKKKIFCQIYYSLHIIRAAPICIDLFPFQTIKISFERDHVLNRDSILSLKLISKVQILNKHAKNS